MSKANAGQKRSAGEGVLRRFWRKTKLLFAVVLFAVLLILIFQNGDRVALDFLFLSTQRMPLSLLLILSFGIGAVAGVVLAHVWNRKT